MKKIIDMHFNIKNYLKNTRNQTIKHALRRLVPADRKLRSLPLCCRLILTKAL